MSRTARRRRAALPVAVLSVFLSLGGPSQASPPRPAERLPVVSGVTETGSTATDLPIPRTDPARARKAADDVLARPQYRVPAPTLVERLQRWVGRVVEDALAALISGGGASLIAWGLLALAVGVVALLATRFARGVTPAGGQATSSTSVSLRTATDWRAEAEAHEQAGRWRPALRCRYRALVADLAAGGVVDEVPGRTAGEYRVAVGVAAPDVAPEFAAATALFERAWYGHAPTSADDAAHLSSLADRVLAGTR